jgi:hypothetical protein
VTLSPSDVDALLPYLTPPERARVLQLTASTRPFWVPVNWAQRALLDCEADVIGFGGAAGGGKTDAAIGLGATQHKRVAFFRRESTQLVSVYDRIAELVGNRDGYNSKWNLWRGVGPRRATFEFGSVPSLGDEERYRGRPKDLLIVDEASNFLESVVRFLMGWVRTTDPGQRCRTVLTFNPPASRDGIWLVRFFAPWLDDKHPRPAKPGELRWYATIDKDETELTSPARFHHKGELIVPQSRTFLPSRVTDNPYLMGTNYYAQLQALPEPLRSQMLYGDFKIGMTDDPFQVIPTEWVEAAMKRWTPRAVKQPMDCLGVDVARGGADRTAIARRHGWWFDEVLTYSGENTPDGPKVASLVMAAKRDRAPINIDVIGVGGSPFDFLRQADQQVEGVRMDAVDDKWTDKSGMLRLRNRRSQLWWRMRELLDPHANNGIALPNSSELKAELCTPKFEVRSGMIVVESRDEIVKKLKRSVDLATAVVLAAMDTPKWFPEQQPNYRPRSIDYDPLRPIDDREDRAAGDYDPFRL